MALRDFIPERRHVDYGGRRFVCRTPTVRTVVLFLDLYGREIREAVRAWAKLVNHPADPVASLLPVFYTQTDKAARVLATCVESDGDVQALASGSQDLCQLLAENVAACVDLWRLHESLNLDEPEGPVIPSTGPSDLEIAFVVLAQDFHCAPHHIADWPFPAYTNAIEVQALLRKQPTTRPSSRTRPASDLKPGGLPGMTIVKPEATSGDPV